MNKKNLQQIEYTCIICGNCDDCKRKTNIPKFCNRYLKQATFIDLKCISKFFISYGLTKERFKNIEKKFTFDLQAQRDFKAIQYIIYKKYIYKKYWFKFQGGAIYFRPKFEIKNKKWRNNFYGKK